MPLDQKIRPLYINRALFLCGFFCQSNFDLESSGGTLAYMRNNVLVRYSAVFETTLRPLIVLWSQLDKVRYEVRYTITPPFCHPAPLALNSPRATIAEWAVQRRLRARTTRAPSGALG